MRRSLDPAMADWRRSCSPIGRELAQREVAGPQPPDCEREDCDGGGGSEWRRDPYTLPDGRPGMRIAAVCRDCGQHAQPWRVWHSRAQFTQATIDAMPLLRGER